MKDQSRIETCSCSNVNTLFASLFFSFIFFGPMWPSHIKPHTKKQQQHHRQLNNTFYNRGGKQQRKKKKKIIYILPVYDFTSGVIIGERHFSPFISPLCAHLDGDCCCYILFVCLLVTVAAAVFCLVSTLCFFLYSRCCSGLYSFITTLRV